MTQHAPEVSPDLFWQTMTAFQVSAALKTAVELEIFTHIGAGKQTAAEIAEAAGASERGVRILCDTLTVVGFLIKDDGHYRLTDSTAAFLDKRSPMYIGSAVDFILSPSQRRGYDDLTNAVRKGGSSVSGDASMDPESEMWVTFARAMAPLMFPTAQAVAENIADGGGDTRSGFGTNSTVITLPPSTSAPFIFRRKSSFVLASKW